jgi:hypothetical protein
MEKACKMFCQPDYLKLVWGRIIYPQKYTFYLKIID